MFIRGGTILTGKIHRHEHMVVVLQGSVTIYTVDGRRMAKAGDAFVSPRGTKRVAIAHEDTRWLTIEATDETDLNRIEDEMIVSDPVEWDELAQDAPPVTEDLSMDGIEE